MWYFKKQIHFIQGYDMSTLTLLQQRDRARNHLESSVKNLLSISKQQRNTKYECLCIYREKRARKRLEKIDKKLLKIERHCGHSKVELYARLIIIFKPELKKEVEELITFS